MTAGRGQPALVGVDASRAFGAGATGTEGYSTALIAGLLRRGRFRYRLYRRDPLAEPPPGAELRVLRPRRLWTHLALARSLWRERPDLLFVPAHVLPWRPLVPAVVTVHDLGYLAFPAAHTAAQRWYLDWSTRRHCQLAVRILADSAATRDDLVRHYGAVPERVEVVHLGVDPDLAPSAPGAVAATAARLGLPPGQPYLLHVGTLQPRKNLARLVRAFAAATAARPELHLVLAGGSGWGGEDLAALAAAAGVAARVHLLGYVGRADLAPLYTGALAAVLPSLYEGFGLMALEAMACGAPLACSATSSLPEVVGPAALLFDPTDEADMARAIARLLDDGALRATLASAGPARAAQFSWDRCAAETEAVLARALAAAELAAAPWQTVQ